jgi:hypothetical protein
MLNFLCVFFQQVQRHAIPAVAMFFNHLGSCSELDMWRKEGKQRARFYIDREAKSSVVLGLV